ncbi:MAG: cysteine hydrolase [Alphaproteobacteria bacterium]|nr:cysteine hydrolase [Alphaproteobacteria bacterium]
MATTTLQEQLEKVSAFLRPENLAQQTLKYDGEVALLVIDVQKMFCDPEGRYGNAETEQVSKRIQSLVPEFRKAGIPVYAVYVAFEPKDISEVDFYEFSPHQDDVPVRKVETSAFKGSDIKEILQRDKRKLLLTCGFNLNACVRETVEDARDAGFDVCVLRDLTGNNKGCDGNNAEIHVKCMKAKGISFTKSGEALELLRQKKMASGQ